MILPLVVAALAACGPGTPEAGSPRDPGASTTPSSDSSSPSVDSAPGTTDTGRAPHTGDSADTGVVAPCPLPPAPTTWTYLDEVPSSEEFAFDAYGYLVNVDDALDALVRTAYPNQVELLAPYSSPEVAGVTFLLDGRLALADEGNGALVLLGMDGSREILLGSLNQPNSITLDAAGQIVVTAFDRILRVDPATGASTVLASLPGLDLDGLVFSADYLQLYFNYDEDSVVGRVALDAAGNPISAGPIVNLPEQPGFELNGMTMDICDNVYAISTGGDLYRVRTDGTAERLITLGGVPGMLTSALHFGSGIGGWERDHLYVMNRYGGLFDLDMGIEGRKEPHLP